MSARLADTDPMIADEPAADVLDDEASVLLDTLRQSLRADIAAFVPTGATRPHARASSPLSDATVAWLRGRALHWLSDGAGTIGQEGGGLPAPGWRLLLARSAAPFDNRGAVIVGRCATDPTAWSASDIAVTKAFAKALAALPGAPELPVAKGPDRRLDDLVTRVAVELMQVSGPTVDAALRSTLQLLTQFFEVDTSFLRHHDHDRGVSVDGRRMAAAAQRPRPRPPRRGAVQR